MILAVDLDDTLCKRPPDNQIINLNGWDFRIYKYTLCTPIIKNIQYVNKLKRTIKKCKMYIYTSRGMSSFKGDIDLIEANLRSITETQLNQWNVNYDKLIFGKLHYDLIIDDKSINLSDINFKF